MPPTPAPRTESSAFKVCPKSKRATSISFHRETPSPALGEGVLTGSGIKAPNFEAFIIPTLTFSVKGEGSAARRGESMLKDMGIRSSEGRSRFCFTDAAFLVALSSMVLATIGLGGAGPTGWPPWFRSSWGPPSSWKQLICPRSLLVLFRWLS